MFCVKIKQLMNGISKSLNNDNRLVDKISEICGKKYD